MLDYSSKFATMRCDPTDGSFMSMSLKVLKVAVSLGRILGTLTPNDYGWNGSIRDLI